MMKFIKVRDVQSPQRANATDSGLDFFVPRDLREVQITWYESGPKLHQLPDETPIILMPNEGVLIPSWISTIIEPGYDLVFENKSWVSVKKHLIIGAKVVDSSYRGEIHLHLINVGKDIQTVKLGEKLAQGILRKVELATPEEITEDEFNAESETERGSGWFWSTWI